MSILTLSLEDLFEGNRSMASMVANKLHIKHAHELQLYTYRDLVMTSRVGPNAHYVMERMDANGMPLRDMRVTIPQAVELIYGSIMDAPISVLQFSLVDATTRRRPVELVTIFDEQYPGLKVYDFGQMLEYGENLSVPRTFADELIVRLQEWKLRDIPE